MALGTIYEIEISFLNKHKKQMHVFRKGHLEIPLSQINIKNYEM